MARTSDPKWPSGSPGRWVIGPASWIRWASTGSRLPTSTIAAFSDVRAMASHATSPRRSAAIGSNRQRSRRMRSTSMRYRNLGRTGVEVSTQCLGAMMFGRMGNRDRAECLKIIDRALEAGINFIDTADVYGRGESEEIVGEALQGR